MGKTVPMSKEFPRNKKFIPKKPEVKEVKKDTMYGMDVKVRVFSPGKLPEKTNKERLEERALLRSIRTKDEKEVS